MTPFEATVELLKARASADTRYTNESTAKDYSDFAKIIYETFKALSKDEFNPDDVTTMFD